MRPRYYLSMFYDNFHGLPHHWAGELVNRKPMESRLVQLPRARQQQLGKVVASVRLGKAFLSKLEKLGIK